MQHFVLQGVHQKCSLEVLVNQLVIIYSVGMGILRVCVAKDALLINLMTMFVIRNAIILNAIFRIMFVGIAILGAFIICLGMGLAIVFAIMIIVNMIEAIAAVLQSAIVLIIEFLKPEPEIIIPVI